jgi:hypothetical protein
MPCRLNPSLPGTPPSANQLRRRRRPPPPSLGPPPQATSCCGSSPISPSCQGRRGTADPPLAPPPWPSQTAAASHSRASRPGRSGGSRGGSRDVARVGVRCDSPVRCGGAAGGTGRVGGGGGRWPVGRKWRRRRFIWIKTSTAQCFSLWFATFGWGDDCGKLSSINLSISEIRIILSIINQYMKLTILHAVQKSANAH